MKNLKIIKLRALILSAAMLMILLSLSIFGCNRNEDIEKSGYSESISESAKDSSADVSEDQLSPEISPESTAEQTGIIEYERIEYFMPDVFFIEYSNMMLIKWGEPVDSISQKVIFGSEELFIGYTVNLLPWGEDITRKAYHHPDSAERFAMLENGEELNEIYNDIILVPESYIPKIVKGERAMILLSEEIIKTPKGNVHIYAIDHGHYTPATDDYHFSIIPVEGSKMIFPDNIYDEGVGRTYASEMMTIFETMKNIMNEDESFPLLKTGASISDLARYLEKAIDPYTYYPEYYIIG